MYIVYKYTFPNNKVYIGRTKTDLNRRAGYNGYNYNLNTLVGRAIFKYGWDNVNKEILYTVETVEEADKLEKELIEVHNSTNFEFGYNMTRGGTGGWSTYYNRRPLSEETKQKIGENSRKHLTGRKVPQEVILKRSAKLKGHIVTEETREKIRQANTGYKHTDEAKRKMSENNCMHNPEIRKKVSDTLKKSGKERAQKRLLTIQERYPEGLKQSEESNRKRSLALKGRNKSEETKQKMRKPKSPEAIENMKRAQKLSYEARKLGMTYQDYKLMLENGGR